MREHLAVVLAHVIGVPPVAAAHVGGEGRLLAFEGDVAAAHDALAEVVEAVCEVPRAFGRHLVGPVGGHGGKGRGDGVEAVELVCHGGGEGVVWVGLEGCREVVVLCGAVDVNIAEALCRHG